MSMPNPTTANLPSLPNTLAVTSANLSLPLLALTPTYAQNQKAHLCAFLEHGEIEISNNQVENAIRPFVVGRKGWLFADTPQGAEASAIIYSLMETAKANSLRLDDDLLHLLSILPERAERNKDFEIDDLLPWSEEMKSWFSAV